VAVIIYKSIIVYSTNGKMLCAYIAYNFV